MAARDVDQAARLAEQLFVPTYQQGQLTTLQRWFRWLDERGGIEGHPLAAIWAGLLAIQTGRAPDAERWAAAVDHWRQENTASPANPYTEAWAAVLRATLCRYGAEQMRADADDAARWFAAANLTAPVTGHLQGMARVLCGDAESGGAFFEDAISSAQDTGAPDVLAEAWGERALLAITHGDWHHAEAFASQAQSVLRRYGIEDAFVCAVQARIALHRGDAPAARQQLARAQRVRPLLTYALPQFAVQARIELTRVHLALADLAAARTLMGEIDELLKRRPGLGILVEEAGELRAQLAKERRADTPGASALTAAELRLLPLLPTHLTYLEIAAELVRSPYTIQSLMKSIYRKLDASSRNQAVTRARELGLLES
jgi:LuxR family transcriptional regulator, maltose regulon positive regulatory protein